MWSNETRVMAATLGGGITFEEGEVRGHVHHTVEQRREHGVVDRRAVDHDALGEAVQVRGGVKPDLQAARAAHGGHECGHCTFAVGPRDVHGRERALGVAEALTS
jgi:hypothetical protein